MGLNQTGGHLIISIDLELNWGVLDRRDNASYKKQIVNGRNVFMDVLRTFEENKISATVATVGLLFNESKEDILRDIPKSLPSYNVEDATPFKGHLEKIGLNEDDDEIHYGKKIIDELKKYKNIEIGTHTYGHYYCMDEGHDKDSFQADLDLAISKGKENDIEIKSIVYPRNQINQDYLKTTFDKGVITYRGNEKSWMYSGGLKRKTNVFVRSLRIIDAYLNLSGHHTYSLPKYLEGEMINLPSSRFFRPVRVKQRIASKFKVRRIKNAMSYAAEKNEIFHLWWHPHNFGANEKIMLGELQQIIEHYKFLNSKYGMYSVTMNQLANHIKNGV
ncbi:MAG: peptidoglycan/xylan/chitin deacetylase (PgdA/CDA1 family) [Patiriisocius sp.]|jgi:peptidoglycan/xylan/chitin deacetylase (PgdA/CDA1 family)